MNVDAAGMEGNLAKWCGRKDAIKVRQAHCIAWGGLLDYELITKRGQQRS